MYIATLHTAKIVVFPSIRAESNQPKNMHTGRKCLEPRLDEVLGLYFIGIVTV